MNVVSREHGGKVYCFVTRKNAKEFTQAEIDEFFHNLTHPEGLAITSGRELHIRPEQKKTFSYDLSRGLEFCTRKYNVPVEVVESEAKRVFPDTRLESFWERRG